MLSSPNEGHGLSSRGLIQPHLSVQQNVAADMSVFKQIR